MKPEFREKLRATLEKISGQDSNNNTSLFDIIDDLQGEEKLKEILFDTKAVSNIANSYGITPPTYVYNFIWKLQTLFKPKYILDPWLNISSPAILLPFHNVIGYCRFLLEFDRINSVFLEKDITIILGDAHKEMEKLNSTFDLIVSFLPFKHRIPRIFATTSLSRLWD